MSEAQVRVVQESNLWREQPVPVSATLITYNQEDYVRQALESVLAQTYPLDVVLADDGSTDGTVAVMEAVLHHYNGPHRIALRHGGPNQGICRNQNAALALARGELIVLFEGDDVSLPNRVEELVKAYLAAGRKPAILGSSIRRMDQHGSLSDEASGNLSDGHGWMFVSREWNMDGCGLAIRRDCFFDVGPIPRHLISGDIALSIRAPFVREGGLAFVPKALVCYRTHGKNISRGCALTFESVDALRNTYRKLIKNEVAQVFELRRIGRYRRAHRLPSNDTEKAWRALFKEARVRALLVMVVIRRPRPFWLRPAFSAMRFPRLRRQAVRVFALAIFPSAHRVYRRFRYSLA